MGDDTGKTDGGTTTTATVTDAVDPAKLAEQVANLNAALKAEREQRQAAAAKLAEIESAAQKAEAARLAEQGQYKTLHEKAEARATELATKLGAYEAREATRIAAVVTECDAVLAGWTPEDRALVPDGLEPDARLAFLRRLDQRIKAAPVQHPTGTRTQGGGKAAPPPECAAEAAKFGKTPEQWFPIWLRTPAGAKWAAGQTKT